MNPIPPQAASPPFPGFDSLESVLWPALVLGVFVATAVIVDATAKLAARLRLIDMVGPRSRTGLPTAGGGGIAVILSTALSALALLGRWPAAGPALLFGILLPALGIAVVGIVHDIHPLRPWIRLGCQIAVAVWITAAFGPLEAVAFPGLGPVPLGAASWPFSILWIVGLVATLGLLEGRDGLAGTVAVASACVGAVLAFAHADHPIAALASLTAASAGGFLVFNWPPARVLLGSAGSGFLGTVLASLPFATQPPSARPAMILPLALGALAGLAALWLGLLAGFDREGSGHGSPGRFPADLEDAAGGAAST